MIDTKKPLKSPIEVVMNYFKNLQKYNIFLFFCHYNCLYSCTYLTFKLLLDTIKPFS